MALHARIRSEIEAKILGGAWPPGHRIPVEHELMAQYGCARMTVNKAIVALVDAGLVVRRRRSGSFVAEPQVHSAVLDIPDIQAEIAGRGRSYAMRLLARTSRAPMPDRPEEQQLAGAGDLLDLRCVHIADGAPFALEERLISLTAVPEAAETDFSATPPGTWLLRHVAWTEAEHRISAISAGKSIASALQIEPRTACLALDRRTWRGEAHITQARQVFPGSAYDLVARFTPRG